MTEHETIEIMSETLIEEAISWLTRLMSGTTTPFERESFQVWCSESVDHAEAFEQAMLTWGLAGRALRLTSLPGSRRRSIGSGRGDCDFDWTFLAAEQSLHFHCSAY